MSFNYVFYVYSAFLVLFPSGCLFLIAFQVTVDKCSKFKIQDSVTRVLLYLVYTTGLFCGLIGYSLHIGSQKYPLWCESYGLPPCFALLGGSKAILYAFFLRRAKHAAGLLSSSQRFFFSVIGPACCALYWIVYLVGAVLTFSGGEANVTAHSVTFCVFDEWVFWFLITAITVDVITAIVSLLLFLIPLRKVLQTLKDQTMSKPNRQKELRLLSVMKWNTVLTFIATLSSLTALLAIPFAGDLIWVFCLGDPFVNAMCTFFMMATNRMFLRRCLTKKCHCCASYSVANEELSPGCTCEGDES